MLKKNLKQLEEKLKSSFYKIFKLSKRTMHKRTLKKDIM